MHPIVIRTVELVVMFIILPISFVLDYPNILKICLGVIGCLYIAFVMFRNQVPLFPGGLKLNWSYFLKTTVLKLLIVVGFTMLYTYYTAPEKLFSVFLQKPILWLAVLCFYTFFSVFPQEIIYRSFFFDRYQILIQSKWLFILCNALLFSLAHLFFYNILVLILTFLGGLFFAFTFYKTKSITLVSIEHALYGNWIFTVGMGEMLGFPV